MAGIATLFSMASFCAFSNELHYFRQSTTILRQLCSTGGPHAVQSKVLCGPV